MTDLSREALRDLDLDVAAKVFGCRVSRDYPVTILGVPVCNCSNRTTRHGWMHGVVPRFSTDVAAAWRVVEQMSAKGWDFSARHLSESPPLCSAQFDRPKGDGMEYYDEDASSVPLAICLAALAATAPTGITSVNTETSNPSRVRGETP